MNQPPGIKYKRLKECHPRVDLKRLRVLKAMYRGGSHLLNDSEVMSTIFPKYSYETDVVYAERRKRAFYENLFALVINQMSAGLAQDPVTASPQTSEPGAALGDYWSSLMKCATAYDEDGSEQRSFDQIMRDLAVEGLVCGWSWLQIELPKSDGTAASRADQDVSGDLNAYVCAWPTDQVTDWEEQDGKLLWIRTYECSRRAPTPDASRDEVTHTWTVWDAEKWVEYRVVESKNPNSPKALPQDEEVIQPSDKGPHSFGRVPWIRLDFCNVGAYLHIGDFIQSACVSYFNRTNGEEFQWTQYNFQQLYEFLGPENPGVDEDISEAQKNPNRARGRRAPGQVHVRGEKDSAKFIGPDMGGVTAGQAATQDRRDSILRMVAQMALSQDTSGAMLRRSADSKKQDGQGQEILLGAIGVRVLTAGRQTFSIVAAVRSEDPEDVPILDGYENFSVDDLDNIVARALQLKQINVPSATYQIEKNYQLAVEDLGDKADDEKKSKIHDELSQAITQDNINWTMQPPEPPAEGEDDGSGAAE
jgi:hypothetical protein